MRAPPPNIIAAAQGSQYGILASTTLAQWAIESEWGTKVTGAHNYFGVKAPELSIPGRLCWTHETVHGVSERVQCRFRDFNDDQAAFDYHGLLIATDPRYRAAYALRAQREPYVRAMAKVYATAPSYADQVLELIADNELAKYDVFPGSQPPPRPSGAAVVAPAAAQAHDFQVEL